MKNHYFLFVVLFSMLFFSGCNPDCALDYDVELLQEASPSGYQIRLTANPMEALEGITVRVGNIISETEFKGKDGLIINVPEGLDPGKTRIHIEDPDCGDKDISTNFRIVDEADFFKTPEFITPAPPIIFIPVNVPPPPPIVTNAWFSPQDSDYCIWFKPDTLLNGKEASDLVPRSALNPKGSAELSLCNDTSDKGLYHDNPVSGFINKAFNIIYVRIDRTNNSSGNLGVEEYDGVFIAVEETPYGDWTPLCDDPSATTEHSRNHMMLLTSRQTGRQLLLYRPE